MKMNGDFFDWLAFFGVLALQYWWYILVSEKSFPICKQI